MDENPLKDNVVSIKKNSDSEPEAQVAASSPAFNAVVLPKKLGMGEVVAEDEVEEIVEDPAEKACAVFTIDSSKIPIMRCGHIANSSTLFKNKRTGQHYREFQCVICGGEVLPMIRSLLGPDGRPIPYLREDLEGRIAVCKCKGETPSNTNGITFLLHLPKKEKDRWYCGHSGWNPRMCVRMIQHAGKLTLLSAKGKLGKKKKK